MYRILLMDDNRNPIADGLIALFMEDIEDFQERWFNLETRDEKEKERFLLSKSGELVADWYSNEPELNIVQEDENAQVYGERSFSIKARTFRVANAYRWETTFYVGEGEIRYKWIGFKGKFYRIGSYDVKGICREKGTWHEIYCIGNKIVESDVKCEWTMERGQAERRLPTVEDYKDNTARTICYRETGEFHTQEDCIADFEHFEMTDEEYSRLFRDLVGDAG